ncbi:MAG: type I 3-dehydroquinate dehydratase [Eubacteriales bacterium]|mgnify:FL=1|nr:type I 3-dehydroquinate dehydratase [Clostridiales bacterium]MDD7302024.1 type I 3-dehydroquinate dehydratase [Eubacteriales bacterium]MDY4434649.1 type I 3-dehydroquinate dehydratase [Candidatus Flemingibacterium sp.]
MKRKPTFLNQNKPLITCMIQADNPTDAIHTIREAQFEGADAYGFQMEVLKKEFRTEEQVKGIFREMGGKPIYVTNYRNNQNQGDSDDECVKGLEFLIKCGATLADVMGDFFAPDPLQITYDAAAVEKQKDTIKRLHDMGAEVLMSSHTFKFMKTDEVLRIVTAQQERGADVAKIVTAANSEEEELENLRTAEKLKYELDIPYLFLAGGSHNKLLRQLGPFLGEVMWLTVQSYDRYATTVQPKLSAIRSIADHFDTY